MGSIGSCLCGFCFCFPLPLLRMRQAAAEEAFFALGPGERDQGVDVALAGDRAVEDDCADGEDRSDGKAPAV